MVLNIDNLYQLLIQEFGKQNWWPIDKNYHEKNNSDPRFEIIIGAILTQNTAWSNVKKALNNLKLRKMLNLKDISEVEIKELQLLIKPSGFFNQKAKRLKNLALHITGKYNGNFDSFFQRDLSNIRKDLLAINGIGPETADSILLYAGNMPIFVVDAYTKRICDRLPIETNKTYDKIQEFFQRELSKKYLEKELIKMYNELHALIVVLAKTYCKTKPECTNCPLNKYCNFKKSFF
jgi:endonuclease-3 related protein